MEVFECVSGVNLCASVRSRSFGVYRGKAPLTRGRIAWEGSSQLGTSRDGVRPASPKGIGCRTATFALDLTSDAHADAAVTGKSLLSTGASIIVMPTRWLLGQLRGESACASGLIGELIYTRCMGIRSIPAATRNDHEHVER